MPGGYRAHRVLDPRAISAICASHRISGRRWEDQSASGRSYGAHASFCCTDGCTDDRDRATALLDDATGPREQCARAPIIAHDDAVTNAGRYRSVSEARVWLRMFSLARARAGNFATRNLRECNFYILTARKSCLPAIARNQKTLEIVHQDNIERVAWQLRSVSIASTLMTTETRRRSITAGGANMIDVKFATAGSWRDAMVRVTFVLD